MLQLTFDHIHLRSPDPEATAAWFEKMLGAEVIRSVQQGAPRIDLQLGGQKIFIMPVAPGEAVNPAPVSPYQGLDHFGYFVKDIDAAFAELKAKGADFTQGVQMPRSCRHQDAVPARAAGRVGRAAGAG